MRLIDAEALMKVYIRHEFCSESCFSIALTVVQRWTEKGKKNEMRSV